MEPQLCNNIESHNSIIQACVNIQNCEYFTKDFLVKLREPQNNIVFHTSDANIDEFNSYAKYALDHDNDAKKRAKDEATSIHIITSKLNTRLNIIYESQISGFNGKPDFIIRLGRNLYIMVSTTQAINKRNEFSQQDADRLMSKKIMGLHICSQNLECLVNEVVDIYAEVRPILHILTPSIENANMCIIAYKNIINNAMFQKNNIRIVITLILNYIKIL